MGVKVVMIIRNYSELIKLKTFEERFEYLKLNGRVGKDTFGFDRYLNQIFYLSPEWKSIRNDIIIRDNGCDLGMDGYEIEDRITIHHMNPIDASDIIHRSDFLLNPEFLIVTSLDTHNAIHYGNANNLRIIPKDRYLYDTCPWKK